MDMSQPTLLNRILPFLTFIFLQVKALCRPPFKRYYSNRNNVFFMFSLFMTLMMVAVPLAWSLWVRFCVGQERIRAAREWCIS